MVHISLPRGISHLGSKHKDKDNGAGSSGNGDRRPSPPRLGSTASTATLSDQKPLILKVYVIKVNAYQAASSRPAKFHLGPKPGCKG